MRNIAILITMQLISAAICFCQIKIPLVDISAPGSPVRISGTVLFQDDTAAALRYTYLIDGSMTNVSSKEILLTIIHISDTGVGGLGLNHTVAVERFFGSNDLNPGGVEGINHSPIRLGPAVSAGSVPAETATSPSATTAELVFLQFADGSTWGDPDAGREQLSVRTKTLGELHKLGLILNERGGPDLKSELLRVGQFQFPAIDSLVQSCMNETAPCLTHRLRSMLKQAELHETEMRAVSRSAFASGVNPWSETRSWGGTDQ
jgi:hypothetical protein